MKIGVVVLTTGRRPEELALALDSVLAQRGVDLDPVVVGNGWEPEGLPDGVRGVGLAVDQGAPAGRNAGVPHVDGELVFFLDDDASLAEPDALAQVADLGQDLLFDGRLTQRGLFRDAALRRLWTDHCSGRTDHRHRLWSVMMLELWFREFIDGAPVAQTEVA